MEQIKALLPRQSSIKTIKLGSKFPYHELFCLPFDVLCRIPEIVNLKKREVRRATPPNEPLGRLPKLVYNDYIVHNIP